MISLRAVRWPSLHGKSPSCNAAASKRIPLKAIISHPELFPVKSYLRLKNSQLAPNTSLVVKLFISSRHKQMEVGQIRRKPPGSDLERPSF